MKKNDIKGLSAFELLDGLDDDMILSASLPEAAPAAAPTKGERVAAFFARMGKGGMAAAIVTVAVALAVLTGVLVAGQVGTGNPAESEPPYGSHGIQGTRPEQTEDGFGADESDTFNGMIAPPLHENTEQSEDSSDVGTPETDGDTVEPPPVETPEQEKGAVAIVSDGMTVYPKGYCVYVSIQQLDKNGEMTGLDGDGPGAAYQLGEILGELPRMRTAGNSYALDLPDHMSLQKVRFFEIVDEESGTFAEIALPAGSEAAADVLKSLGSREGDYVVVLDIFYNIIRSENEYTRGLDEYAFRLTVDSSMDITYPLRLLVGDKTYYLEGSDGINSGNALAGMAASIPTATVTRDTDIDFYLAPQGTLQSVAAYDGSFRLMMIEPDTEPLVALPVWEAGDYYFVFTATFPFEGGSLTLEYPIHIKLVEEIEEETTYPNDVGETPDEPTDPLDRVLSKAEPMTPQVPDGSVLVGQTALYMWYAEDGSDLTKQVSRMAVYRDATDPYIHHLYADVLADDGRILQCETQAINGYFALLENEGTVVLATLEGKIPESGESCTLYTVMEAWLSWTDADAMNGEDIGDVRLLRVPYEDAVWNAPMDHLENYLKTMGRAWGMLPAVLRENGGEETFGVLVNFWTDTVSPHVYRYQDSTGAAALETRYVMLDESYFETVWTAFVQRMTDRAAGKVPTLPPPFPETNPRVVVASPHGSVIFETEADGFLAWSEHRLAPSVSWMPRIDGTPAADVIFDDGDAMRALPSMEMVYGDTLTLFLDAAGDDLILVTLYDAKGGFITSGADLSVVNTLQNEGWDRHVIVIVETHTLVSETELACYEYAFELTIKQP